MKPAEQEALALIQRFAERFTEEPCGGPHTKRWAKKLWHSGRVLLGRRRKVNQRLANPAILKCVSNIANYLHDDELEDFRNQVREGNDGGVESHVYRDVIRVLMWLRGSDKGWKNVVHEEIVDA